MLPKEVTIKFNPKLLLLSPVAALLMFWLFFLPWDSSNAPAWVQAVGTIVAIGVAVVVPLYQRTQERNEKIREHADRGLARSEQLWALCSEGYEVVQDLDSEAAFADYSVNNALRRAVLNDLLGRLNEAQLADPDADRMRVGVRFRFCIYDWLKYFGDDMPVDVGRLHERVERVAPRLERVKIDAENIVRRHKGQALLPYPVDQEQADDDFPF